MKRSVSEKGLTCSRHSDGSKQPAEKRREEKRREEKKNENKEKEEGGEGGYAFPL